MKNGWRKVVIFSLIFIILETVGAILLMLPFYSRQMVFNNIEKGNSIKTDAYYDMLSDSQKDKVQNYLEDFAATICQDYIDGKMTYEQTMASLDALSGVDKSDQIAVKYIKDVSSNELKKVINELYKSSNAYDNDYIIELRVRLGNIISRLDNDTKESIMIDILNERYKDFLNQVISYEDMRNLCKEAQKTFYYEAYDYAEVIANNISVVMDYRALYDELSEGLSSEDYFTIIDACQNVMIDPWDTDYGAKFEELYTQAYENGKVYYAEQLDKLSTGSDKKAAIALMKTIEKYYGSDIDLSSARKNLISDWQEAYLSFVSGYDAAANDVDTVLLYDINEDNIPEMFLYNSANKDNAYVGCEVVIINGSSCKDLGYYNIINLCDDGYLVTVPASGMGDEAYALTEYDGKKLTEGATCKKSGETYYVDGTEVSDADYLSVRTGILSHISPYTISNSKSASLLNEEAEEYIMLFGN